MPKNKFYNREFSENGIDDRFGRKKFHIRRIFLLLKPSKEDTVLDVGCDKGELVEQLRPYVRKIIGIDVNNEIIQILNRRNILYMDATNLKFPDESFNKLIYSHVLEHIKNLRKAFFEMERVLKPEGIAVLIYPFESIRGMNIAKIAYKIYGNIWYARKLHLHKLNPKRIRELTNLRIIKKGLFFGPYPTYYTVLRKENGHY